MSEPPTASQPVISRFWPFRRFFYGWAIAFAGASSAFALVPTQGPVMSIFVNPIVEELGWPRTVISVGFVLGTFAGGLFQWLLGGLFDRYGARWMSVISSSIVAAAMLGLGMMTQTWHFWLFFAAGRGFAAAGSQLGTMVALASWFIKKRGRTVGIVGVGQRAGQAVLPLPLFAIMAAFSWREAFFCLAALAIIMAAMPNALLFRRRPEDYGLLPDGETVSGDAESLAARSQELEETWTLGEAKRTRTLWLLILGQGGIVLTVNAVNLFAADNFQSRGISDGLAVTAVAIFAAVSAISLMAWSFLLESLHIRYVGLMVTALFTAAMVVAYVADTFPLAVVFSLLYGLGLGGWTPISRMLFANYFGRRHFGSIRGFAASIMIIANPLGPVLGGFIADTTGSYQLAFLLFGGVLIFSFVAFGFAVPPKKRVQAT